MIILHQFLTVLLIMGPMFRIRASSEQKYSDVLCWVCYLSREFKREKRKEKNAQIKKSTHSYSWLLSVKGEGPPKTILFKHWKPSDMSQRIQARFKWVHMNSLGISGMFWNNSMVDLIIIPCWTTLLMPLRKECWIAQLNRALSLAE